MQKIPLRGTARKTADRTHRPLPAVGGDAELQLGCSIQIFKRKQQLPVRGERPVENQQLAHPRDRRVRVQRGHLGLGERKRAQVINVRLPQSVRRQITVVSVVSRQPAPDPVRLVVPRKLRQRTRTPVTPLCGGTLFARQRVNAGKHPAPIPQPQRRAHAPVTGRLIVVFTRQLRQPTVSLVRRQFRRRGDADFLLYRPPGETRAATALDLVPGLPGLDCVFPGQAAQCKHHHVARVKRGRGELIGHLERRLPRVETRPLERTEPTPRVAFQFPSQIIHQSAAPPLPREQRALPDQLVGHHPLSETPVENKVTRRRLGKIHEPQRLHLFRGLDVPPAVNQRRRVVTAVVLILHGHRLPVVLEKARPPPAARQLRQPAVTQLFGDRQLAAVSVEKRSDFFLARSGETVAQILIHQVRIEGIGLKCLAMATQRLATPAFERALDLQEQRTLLLELLTVRSGGGGGDKKRRREQTERQGTNRGGHVG